MKRIYATQSHRVEKEGDSPEDKGELFVIDWETKQTIGVHEIDSYETVEVGRTRGAGGITWHEDKIYIACRQGVFSLNPDTYEKIKKIEMGEPLGIHQMKSDGKTIWTACMNADCLQLIRNDVVVDIIPTTQFGTTPRVNRLDYNGLNAIGFSPGGEVFLLYSHKGQIYNWSRKEVAVTGLTNAPHDLCFINERELLFTQSGSRELFKADVRTGQRSLILSKNSPNVPGFQHAIPGWLRGIAYHGPSNSIFLMSAPGIIVELDASSWSERGYYQFSSGAEENPFDLLLDPRDW